MIKITEQNNKLHKQLSLTLFLVLKLSDRCFRCFRQAWWVPCVPFKCI